MQTITNQADIDAAINAFLSGRQTGSLLMVIQPGVLPSATAPQPQKRVWKPITDPRVFDQDFDEIRVMCDTRLSDEEISRLSGCLGYALTETVKGEELSLPTVSRPVDAGMPWRAGTGVEFTVLDFYWPSDQSIRTSPDFNRAFEVASVYIPHGSKIRTTNLAGPNTRGTQLVSGIGPGRCNITFYVR